MVDWEHRSFFRLLDPRAHLPATKFLESGRAFLSNWTNPRRDLFRRAPWQGYCGRQRVPPCLRHRWWVEAGGKPTRTTPAFANSTRHTSRLSASSKTPWTTWTIWLLGESTGFAKILSIHHGDTPTRTCKSLAHMNVTLACVLAKPIMRSTMARSAWVQPTATS